jgi:hypothetical protein
VHGERMGWQGSLCSLIMHAGVMARHTCGLVRLPLLHNFQALVI